MGISVSSRGGDPDDVGVSLVVHGVKTNGSIIKPAGKFNHVIDSPEINFRLEDTIMFITDTMVSLLLEINL